MSFDTYGHLMPGGLDDGASAANAYPDRMSGEHRTLTVAG
jgi:hypothetical protein